MRDHFMMMAAYNRWCNERIYDAAARLSDADYRADLGAFFKSVHGTLNHILVGDRVWLSRFTRSGPVPTALNEILYDDFDGLSAARREEDGRIAAYVERLDWDNFQSILHYRALSRPDEVSLPLVTALHHFFNHQTYHRGQVTALLTRLNGASPPIDLLYYALETGDGLRPT
ncbi:DinB family protein [Amorphus coralli]|uniref:DinB family protein n=1 Tax=Amorphus coralli TaxID=340680 RepID=UPI000590346E|nr:DinB family protein [Amorphus coralli]